MPIIPPGQRLQTLAEQVYGTEWARPVSDLTGVAVRTCQRTRKAILDGQDDPRAIGVLAALQTALQEALRVSHEASSPARSPVTGMRCGADAMTPHAESYGHEYTPNGAGSCRHCGRRRDENDPWAGPDRGERSFADDHVFEPGPPIPMNHITDVTHFLDEKGAIGPQTGPGARLGEFFGAVITKTTLQKSAGSVLKCIECSAPGRIESDFGIDDSIEWSCACCGSKGVIYNWRNTLWDMTAPCPRAQ